MKQWSVDTPDKEFKGMRYAQPAIPKVGENEVLVKFEAASLNFRDLAIAKVSRLLVIILLIYSHSSS